MRKRMFLFLVLFAFVFCPFLFADMDDKATLGGQTSNGTYHWKVDSDGDLIGQKTITFSENLLATGTANSSLGDVVTTDTAIPVTYGTARVVISARTVTIADGTAGQLLHIVGTYRVAGTLTISPSRATGFSSITMDANGEQVTLLYVDDTYGWVVIGAIGATLVAS